MMVKISKNKLAIGLAFMITFTSSRAYAFGIPLLSNDIKRLIDSARIILQQVMIIKQEIDSNLAIIKEIQNGGFASAGAMIFDKIQNGDYDRFGNALTSVQNESKNMAISYQATKERKRLEQEGLAQNMTEEQARAYARQQVELNAQKQYEEYLNNKAAAKAARGENTFQSSYNWLKNNTGVTSGASSALRGVDSGNWGQVLTGAAGVTGSSINSKGENTVGNIFNDASYGAGSALNSALSGDWTGAFNDAAHGAGSAVGGATGSEGVGAAVGGLGSFGAGVADVVIEGGNLGNIIDNVTNSSYINEGLDEMSSGYGQMQDQQREAAEAAAAAQKEWAEGMKKSTQEAFDKYQAQKKCNDCISQFTNAGVNQAEAGMRCRNSCSGL